MRSCVPTFGLLPAAFSNTALLTIAITSGMGFSEQARDLGEVALAELRLDHVDVRGVAGEVRREVLAPAGLRLEAVLGAVVEDRAEAAALGARDVDGLVDDKPRDALLLLRAQDAALVVALGEAFLLADRVDPPQEAAELHLGRLLERERQVVGVAGVGRVALRGEAREPVVEAAAREVRDRRRGGRALRQEARPHDVAARELRAVRGKR